MSDENIFEEFEEELNNNNKLEALDKLPDLNESDTSLEEVRKTEGKISSTIDDLRFRMTDHDLDNPYDDNTRDHKMLEKLADRGYPEAQNSYAMYLEEKGYSAEAHEYYDALSKNKYADPEMQRIGAEAKENISLDENIQIRTDREGNKVTTQSFEDGSKSVTTKNKDGGMTVEEFDDKGELREENRYMDGVKTNETLYREDGTIRQDTSFRSDGNVEMANRYDETGALDSRMEYNKKGELEREMRKTPTGREEIAYVRGKNLEGEPFVRNNHIHYDKDNKRTGVETFEEVKKEHGGSEWKRTKNLMYDKDGNEKDIIAFEGKDGESIEVRPDGSEVRKGEDANGQAYSKTYDKEGRLREETLHNGSSHDDMPESKTTYNEKGEFTKHMEFDSDGKPSKLTLNDDKKHTVIRFDEKSQPLRETVYKKESDGSLDFDNLETRFYDKNTGKVRRETTKDGKEFRHDLNKKGRVQKKMPLNAQAKGQDKPRNPRPRPQQKPRAPENKGRRSAFNILKATNIAAKVGIMTLGAPLICGAMAMAVAIDTMVAVATTDSPTQALQNPPRFSALSALHKGVTGSFKGIDKATTVGMKITDKLFKKTGR